MNTIEYMKKREKDEKKKNEKFFEEFNKVIMDISAREIEKELCIDSGMDANGSRA